MTDFNRAAFALMDSEAPEIEGLLAGDALGCIHAVEPGGCGTPPHCKKCVLRNCVESTLIGAQGIRDRGLMAQRRGGSTVLQEFVTATAKISVGGMIGFC